MFHSKPHFFKSILQTFVPRDSFLLGLRDVEDIEVRPDCRLVPNDDPLRFQQRLVVDVIHKSLMLIGVVIAVTKLIT